MSQTLPLCFCIPKYMYVLTILSAIQVGDGSCHDPRSVKRKKKLSENLLEKKWRVTNVMERRRAHAVVIAIQHFKILTFLSMLINIL